ncbi:hypothetical protein B0H19DRAFT_1274919 [Mycena capillaripes]|nr:hypothetical protein B0H19DRAFT_1274919 [Mycena capillaripes]
MSAKNTPILAGSIPAFKLFMAAWNAMLADADLQEENISTFIDLGLAVTNTYYNKMGDTDAYIIAMFINPSIRFEWIRKNWSRTDQERAKKIIIDKASETFDHMRHPLSLRMLGLEPGPVLQVAVDRDPIPGRHLGLIPDLAQLLQR